MTDMGEVLSRWYRDSSTRRGHVTKPSDSIGIGDYRFTGLASVVNYFHISG